MNDPAGKKKRRRKSADIRGDRKSSLIGTLVGWVMRITSSTLRMEIRDECGIGNHENAPPPCIYVLWHNRFFCVPPAWRKLCGKTRRTVTLTSASKDGDMVAKAMEVFGLGAVRGSSSRRAVAALVGLKRALVDGFDVCLTPDGPRGPRYKIQPGFIKLAQATGAPIIPVHVRFSSAWRLKTWDRFVIPKPFSKVVVVFGKSLTVPASMDESGFDAKLLEIETLMVAGTDDA